MRTSGILLHISSLPSNYGIGTFGKEAYKFVDFLNDTKQTYWQILPLGPTSYGDSPYQTFSAFALNPYFIDLDLLVEEGLLSKKDILDSTQNPAYVDYAKVYNERFVTLRKAYAKFNKSNHDYINFLTNNSYWLPDYSLFMAVKAKFNGVSWIEWPEDIRLRRPESVEAHHIELQNEVEFQYFMQYTAFKQWYNLKNYANSKGVKFIGDMPIYVAYDSSDVWTKPQYFQLDENRKPILVAGVPPDNFSVDGQLWGNPLYNWPVLENEYFSWWIDRVRSNTDMFDMVRIDHFIGFVNYFGIPATDTTARNGQWYKGPSHKLFDAIKWQLGERAIIAEDLGVLTDEVRDLLRHTGFPGMKLLQFGFDASGESDYLPHHYHKNVIAYTGTHDNMTTKEWFDTLDKADLKFAKDYLDFSEGAEVDALIRATLASVADTAIIPMQDYLALGKEARFNIPSTLGGNWTWRLIPNQINKETKDKVKFLTKTFGRATK